jgi:hypothetical protein
LAKAFLQFLAIVVAGSSLDLLFDLGDTGLDIGRSTFTANYGGIIFIHGDTLAGSEVLETGVFEFVALLLR